MHACTHTHPHPHVRVCVLAPPYPTERICDNYLQAVTCNIRIFYQSFPKKSPGGFFTSHSQKILGRIFYQSFPKIPGRIFYQSFPKYPWKYVQRCIIFLVTHVMRGLDIITCRIQMGLHSYKPITCKLPYRSHRDYNGLQLLFSTGEPDSGNCSSGHQGNIFGKLLNFSCPTCLIYFQINICSGRYSDSN